jgi:hypothetical protein
MIQINFKIILIIGEKVPINWFSCMKRRIYEGNIRLSGLFYWCFYAIFCTCFNYDNHKSLRIL